MTNDVVKVFGVNLEYLLIGLVVAIIIICVLLIVTLCKLNALKKKYNAFMMGKSGQSLEDGLVKRIEQVEMLQVRADAQRKDIEAIFDELELTFCKMGLVKYDAFNEMGGKLSFALTMLDKKNNGFLLNSMQSREGCYTYVKEILDGKSYIDLGDEEKKSLEKALNQQ